jgi:Domain of unknown function (DU1801)
LKTRETDASVEEFLAGVTPERRRLDSQILLPTMRRITGLEAKMWGDRMVGFGRYHYVYDSGREGDLFLTGFAPGKAALTIYIMPGFAEFRSLLERLGKHKTGRSCLYINKLDDIDLAVLEDLVRQGLDIMKRKYGG